MNKNGGKNRDWGYASYDVDDPESENLTYTSYEKNGSVNKYHDNGDGGHSHEHWNSKNDYNQGKDPDQSRIESNDSNNPSIGEVQDNGGCYLTTACLIHYKNEFDDNCYELSKLRWFRDKYVSKDDILTYYSIAPQIVKKINSREDSNTLYEWIYNSIVKYCVDKIEKKDYEEAYIRYKDSVKKLAKHLLNPKEL